MDHHYEEIKNTVKYAREHNIDTSNPETWDDNYRKRQHLLAGIIPEIEKDIKAIKEGIEKNKRSKDRI